MGKLSEAGGWAWFVFCMAATLMSLTTCVTYHHVEKEKVLTHERKLEQNHLHLEKMACIKAGSTYRERIEFRKEMKRPIKLADCIPKHGTAL